MAIDKSRTPAWMKATLILLAVVFVFGFVTIAANPFQGVQSGNQGGTDPLSTVNQQYQPAVAALTAQLQSTPESYTILVSLGNTYFDWANAVQQQSRTSTAAVGADQPLWISAKDAYSRAVAINAQEPPVMVDYAITRFYSGDTNGAIETAEQVAKTSPDFAPAYFNLGIFYSAVAQNDRAITALERYLKLDPEGKQGDVNFAKQQLQTLRSGGATQTP